MQPLKRNNKREQRNRMERRLQANEALLKKTLAEALGKRPENMSYQPAGTTAQSCGGAI